jgi:transposase
MRTRNPTGFDLWLEQALSSELATFARGLRRDGDAVRAAFTEPWGTSPVEGRINRLKTKKRQMYGRANYPLLRSRVLAVA